MSRGQLDRRGGQAHARGAGAHLLHRLFAGNVDAGGSAFGGLAAHLEQEGGFADSWIPREQHRRAGDDAAAADPVEFLDAGQDPGRRSALRLQSLEIQASRLGGAGRREGAGRTALNLLDQPVPAATGRTLPSPFGMHRAAGLADIDGAVAGHGRIEASWFRGGPM
jgi:hypothetical protein